MGAILAFVAAWIGAGDLRIHDIQGAAHLSPVVGQTVAQVEGVVTARFGGGFYLQDRLPDADDATSEAVRIRSPGSVNIGDVVQVTGTVFEVRAECTSCAPGSEADANLTTTEIAASDVAVVGRAELPVPIRLGPLPGERSPPTEVVENDALANVESESPFDPAQDGIDFYESLEAMRVRVDDAMTVGPAFHLPGDASEIVVVARSGFGTGPQSSRGGLLRAPVDDNPERIFVSHAAGLALPDVDVGDTFVGPIVGVLDYAFGHFHLIPTAPLPPVAAGPPAEWQTWPDPSADELTVATFNLQNFAPQASRSKTMRLAELLARDLGAPDLVAVQEVQDSSGPLDDGTTDASRTYQALIEAIAAVGGPVYRFCDIAPEDGRDGGEPGGNIRVGFLFRTDRGLSLAERPGASSLTPNFVRDVGATPELAFSPGRISPSDEAFSHSRKPLAAEFAFRGTPIFVVGVHFNSQRGDPPVFGRFQPPGHPSRVQRTAQARIVADFARQVLAIDPGAKVLVLGDMNDVAASAPLEALTEANLEDLLDILPEGDRYTSIFQGNGEGLDRGPASRALAGALRRIAVVHRNVDFARRVSDHDPMLVRFQIAAPAAARRFEAGCACSSRAPPGTNGAAWMLVFAWFVGTAVRLGWQDHFLSTRIFSSKDRQMTHRLTAGAFFVVLASCLTPKAPESAPGSTSSAASTGGGDCSRFKVQNKAQLEDCKQRCREEQRDQSRSCSNPNCQEGIGQAMGICMGKCGEAQKSAQQAKCYKE